MGSTIVEQDFPFDIIHSGERDANRHNKRVDDAVRKQLGDVIGQQDIITQDGNKKVKVRLRNLNQYKIVHNRDRVDSIGRDQFDDLEEDEIISRPTAGKSSPKDAGDANGDEIYETEYTVEELTDMMMEELKLPDLDDTMQNEIISESLEWTDLRKGTGVRSLLDKKRTVQANILRRAKQGKKNEPIGFIKDDLRYRSWNEIEEKHSNAVIFAMMDRSASMWQEKIYLVKALYFWIVQFLKRKHQHVVIKFIAHDYNARELTEKEFFTVADSGGTRVSSAYALCKEMIEHNYPKDMWNIYCFHASDGDSWGDESDCMKLVEQIISLGAKLFAYAEINVDNWHLAGDESELLEHFRKLMQKQTKVLVSTIRERADILESLKSFLVHSVSSGSAQSAG